jgi:hypothetical protein
VALVSALLRLELRLGPSLFRWSNAFLRSRIRTDFIPRILFNRIVDRVGFGWAIRAIAFMFLGLQIIAILTVRSRLVHHRKPVIVKAFVRPYYSDRKFLYNALGAFFTFWGILIPGNYIVLAAQASGMSPYLSSYLIPIINASR